MNQLFGEFVADILRRRKLLWFCVLVGVIAYGYELFHFNFSIDEEVFAELENPVQWWIGVGRWGMALLNVVLLEFAAVPVVTTLLTIVGLSLSVVFTAAVWREEDGVAIRIAAPFAIAFPTLSFIMTFSVNNFGAGIGLALAASSIYVITCGGWRMIALSATLLGVAMGMYQSCLFVTFPIIAIYYFLGERSKGTGPVGGWVLYAVNVLAAAVIYLLVAKLLLVINGMELRYIQEYFNISDFAQRPVEIFTELSLVIMKYLYGRHYIFIENQMVLGVTLMAAVLIAIRVEFGKGISAVAALLAVVFLVLLSPFALSIIAAQEMPPRTYVALPLAVASIVFLGARAAGHRARWLLGILAFICFVKFAAINNRLSYSENLSWQADRELAAKIIEKAEENGIRFTEDYVPLFVLHAPTRFKSRILFPADTMGASFFRFAAGSYDRVAKFMNTTGIVRFRPANGEEIRRILAKTDSLSDWPEAGSVAMVDGVFVIKFGPMNGYQKDQMELDFGKF